MSKTILTENYRIKLRPETYKPLMEKFKLNLNKRYSYRGKQYALETIIIETVRKIANYVSGSAKTLEQTTLEFKIHHVYLEMRNKILSMTPEKKKAKNK